ncbi:alpha-E domain-containing protein [Microbacterium sp. EST19A]|uniref:alpha-E domain-containing protein n=1 Tax=Microbacterium sp. EST19A TaxID=2862681 RepID=UPI001CBFBD93|nr:alpha-E domain-containing protein [Microbacterium sp. EST19A]
MLSRIAEALFWIGRYVERADGTARILDVHLQLLLEDPWVEEDTACRALLSVMGTTADGETVVGRDDVVRLLALDRDHSASIAHSIAAARENARRAREIISTDLWETLNESNARMPLWIASDKTHPFFRWVRDRSALAFGVVDSSTSRDEAWQFFVLGRSIERADMTARLLATRSLTDAGGPSWTTLLRSCGAYEAHLRGHRAVPTAASAVEFLLVDKLFPRSVLSSILQAEECLRGIDPAGAFGAPDRAHRVLGRMRSELEYRPVADIVHRLSESMEEVQVAISVASDAIRERYFPSIAMPVWIGEAL